MLRDSCIGLIKKLLRMFFLKVSKIVSFLPNYNLKQNIWNTREKSSKSRKERKILISTFACFLTVIAKV